MKVFVAIPSLDQVSARFVQCLLDLETPPDTEVLKRLNAGTLVYDSRNALAEKAIGSKAKYTFWLDTDMTFMPDTLTMMIKTLEDNRLDILAGMYYRRRPPFTPTIFSRVDVSEKVGVQTADFNEIPNELFKIAGCGFGCVLMKTDVLMNVLVRFGTMFSPLSGVGEDLSFCWRARKCGYEIYCDPSIVLGHEVHSVITKSNRSMYTNGYVVKAQRTGE